MIDSGNEALSKELEKLMSLSEAEYRKSIEAFGGVDAQKAALAGAPVSFALIRGQATITYERLADTRLGGLLRLPQARIVIRFRGVPEAAQEEFLRRFDIAFQRGGG